MKKRRFHHQKTLRMMMLKMKKYKTRCCKRSQRFMNATNVTNHSAESHSSTDTWNFILASNLSSATSVAGGFYRATTWRSMFKLMEETLWDAVNARQHSVNSQNWRSMFLSSIIKVFQCQDLDQSSQFSISTVEDNRSTHVNIVTKYFLHKTHFFNMFSFTQNKEFHFQFCYIYIIKFSMLKHLFELPKFYLKMSP